MTTATPGAWHEVLDHTSELLVRLHAPGWRELLAEAGRALADALRGGAERETPPHAAGPWRALTVAAPDRLALLVDWLNELLYHAEAEWWIPTEIVVDEASHTEMRARARGVTVAAPPAAVKAATLHGVRVEEVPDGIEATVLLDV